MPPDRGRLHGAMFVVGAALLWSTGGLFIKLAPLSGLEVAFGRSLVTSVFYLIVLRPNLRAARLSTALAYAGMIVAFVSANKMTTAANAVFLQYTGSVYVLVLGPWILRERFHRIDAICVVLALAGMSLFFLGDVGSGRLAGNLVGALSGVFFAFTILFLRRDAARNRAGGPGNAMPSTTAGNLLASALLLPLVADHLSQMAAGTTLLVLVYLGVVQMGISYMLFDRGLRRVPAATASLIAMLEPALNPVWVFLGTGERPGVHAIVGGGIVLGAVALRTVAMRAPGAPAE